MADFFNAEVTRWGQSIVRAIPQIVEALIILAITFWADDRLQRAVEGVVGKGRGGRELARLLGRLVRIGVIIVGLLVVLGIFGQAGLLASFITSLGIFGLLIAFALQDITKNFAAGVLLLLQRPFNLDDRIRVGANEGIVTDISLRTTVLRTVDGLEVMIPNADVFTSTIVNLTRYPLRRHSITLTLPLDQDAVAARQTLEDALRRVPRLEPQPAPHIASSAVGKDDQQFEARFWLKSAAPEMPAVISAATLALQEAVQSLRADRQPAREAAEPPAETQAA